MRSGGPAVLIEEDDGPKGFARSPRQYDGGLGRGSAARLRDGYQRMSKRDLARKGQVLAVETGQSPLEMVLGHARGTATLPSSQLQAAIAALPYCHPRLAQVQHSGGIAINPDKATDAELAAIALAGGGAAAEAEGD